MTKGGPFQSSDQCGASGYSANLCGLPSGLITLRRVTTLAGDHAAGVRSTVDEISEQNDAIGAGGRQSVDQCFQFVSAAMDVTDRDNPAIRAARIAFAAKGRS